jgi:ABC-type Fe3+-siderophore transport system permease subunit
MRYLTGLIVPTILLFAGMLAKKLVRGKGWEPNDFYLGVELTLGALTSALLQIFDIIKEYQRLAQVAIKAGHQDPPVTQDALVGVISIAGFVVVTFVLFLLVLTFHQDWEHEPDSGKKRWILGVLCNILGFALMFAFLLLIKGLG